MANEILDDYDAFIKRKASEDVESGFEPSNLGGHLFDFQSAIVEWACKRGRAAIFADTGLGKTAMQTEWARQVTEHTGGMVLIAAPLCVAQQTVEESAKFGIHIQYCRMTPLCRATDPVESFMAVDQAADLIKSHERLIVAALEQHGPYGVDAIARLCNLTGHAVGKRVSVLHTSGRIELTGRSVKSDSGRMQREWRVASA